MVVKSKFRNISISIVLLVVFLGLYAWLIEPHWAEWTKVDLPIENLPSALENKTLVQISDLHIGDRVDKDYLIKNLHKTQRLNPNIVAYTGDYITLVEDLYPYEELKEILPHFAKGKLATVAILGNHDYGRYFSENDGADKISALLKENGITVLRNDYVDIQGLRIIGIDDYWGTNFYPERAMQYYDKDQATLVLCHNPDVSDLDVWEDYEGWILSGHTHAGQVRIPFWGAPILPVKNKKYDEGKKILEENRVLYINRGVGHSLHIRFNARPEVTIFTLKSTNK